MRSRLPRSWTAGAGNAAGPPAAAELAAALERHVLSAWFPRGLDLVHGGFLCDFDAAWRPCGEQVKMLEFQARQTRVAALGCRLHPGDERWSEWCRHGFDFLRRSMWDSERGGFFALCARDGKPLEGGYKHGHGLAYAIQACSEVARTLADPEALALAREAFSWLDEHAWDGEHGGYWGWLRADGTPYAVVASAAPRELDQLGTPVGAKDTNVNGDALEALTELVVTGGVALAARRVAELVASFERMVSKHGTLPARLTRSLDPLDEVVVAGNELQASYRLPLARAALGAPLGFGAVERTLRAHAATERGATGGIPQPAGDEQWWAQFEYLRSAAFAAAVDPESRVAARAELAAHWRYLGERFFDEKQGGVFRHPRRGDGSDLKGERWKDGSHEAFALVSMLEGPPERPSTARTEAPARR